MNLIWLWVAEGLQAHFPFTAMMWYYKQGSSTEWTWRPLCVDVVRMHNLFVFGRNILEAWNLINLPKLLRSTRWVFEVCLICSWSKCAQLAKSICYLYAPPDHSSHVVQLAPATLWGSVDFPESLFQQSVGKKKKRKERNNQQINIQELVSLCFIMVSVKMKEKYSQNVLFWIFSGSLFLALFT